MQQVAEAMALAIAEVQATCLIAGDAYVCAEVGAAINATANVRLPAPPPTPSLSILAKSMSRLRVCSWTTEVHTRHYAETHTQAFYWGVAWLLFGASTSATMQHSDNSLYRGGTELPLSLRVHSRPTAPIA